MSHGGHIAWGRLLVGSLLAALTLALAAALIGPIAYAHLTGGTSVRLRSDAMAPTLLAGDWLLAEPVAAGSVPERGAIVLYEWPRGSGVTLVRRVIGLPGERVQVRGGVVHIDGVRARMERVGERVIEKRPAGRGDPVPACLDDPVPIGGRCRQEIWRETLPDGTSHLVINSRGEIGVVRAGEGRGSDEVPPVRVPEGHVFVMADNRDNAADSRQRRHGPVPLPAVSHRVWMIHSSLGHARHFFAPRLDRFFRRLD